MARISQKWLVMNHRSLALFALSSMVLVSTAACLGRLDGSSVSGDQSLDSYPSSSGVAPSPSTPPSTPRPSPSTPPSGTRPSLPPEKPWDGATWDGGPWVPGSSPTSLEDAKQQMVGTWIGVARTPWRPPYLVRLSFASTGPFTGTYTSQCIDSHGDCIGMYYGTDANVPNKTFGLEAVKSNGAIDGVLAIAFSADRTSAYRETIRELVFDASGNGLRFDVYNGDYGPIAFDLRRAP